MKISRKLVWIVAVAMLVNCFAAIPGFAAEGYSDGEFTKIYSFSDYNVAFTTAVAAFPGDMIGQRLGWRNANHGYVDYEGEDRSSRVFKLASTAEPIVPFGTNFLDGYLHVSFDYLHTARNTLTFMLACNNTLENSQVNSVGIDGTQYYNDNTANNEPFNQDEYDYTRFINGAYNKIFETGNASYQTPINRITYNNAWGWGMGDVRQDGTHPAGQSLKDTWYKVDIYLDRVNTNNYYVYIDGILADYKLDKNGNDVSTSGLSSINYDADGSNAIKGIAFRHDTLRNYNGGAVHSEALNVNDDYVYLDNVYVNHYTSDDVKNDTIKLIADTLGKNVLEAGDKLNVAFSEALAAAPAKEDVVIKDESGKAFTDFTVNADVAQATITLGETVGTGKYTVEVKNVKGAISNNAIEGAVSFMASSAPVASSGTTFNYVDEDFEGLEEGVVLPNWYYQDPVLTSGVANTRYYTADNAAGYANGVVPVERNGRKAVKFSKESGTSDGKLYYYFPAGTAKGSFKAEFDVMHENGGWTFGFINDANYQAAMHKFKYGNWDGYRLEQSTYSAAGWNTATTARTTAPTVSGKTADIDGADAQRQSIVANRAAQSVFIGMGNRTDELENTTDGFEKRAMSPNLGIVGGSAIEAANKSGTRSETNNVSKFADNLTVAPNVWTKVEIDVNDDTKVYTVTVTPYNEDGTLDTESAKTTTHKDFAANRFNGGIMGIRLSRNGAGASSEIGDVCFDNVRVYKTSTTYLDDDFNDYKTETSYVRTRQQGPSGWQQWTDKTHTETGYPYYEAKNGLIGVTSVARNATDTGASEDDRAMHLYWRNPTVFKTLDNPVPAGQPFAIEFDVYNVGANTNSGAQNTWSFMQIGKEDTYILPTYNYPNTMTKNGRFSISKDMFVNYWNTNQVDDTEIKNFKQWYDGAESAYDETKGNTTYAYISGDLMRNNIVFGRRLNGPDTPAMHINANGRGSHYSGGWNQNWLIFTPASGSPALTRNTYVDRVNLSTGMTPAWVNYKVICIPESAEKTTYKITATHLDTGYVYTSTFSNSRDWFTTDTHAIGFSTANFAANWDTVNGTVGNYFDNVKVYAVDSTDAEVTSISLQSVEKVEAINGLGEATDVTSLKELPAGTSKLSVTFTSPVNELLPQNASLYTESYTGSIAEPQAGENEDYTSVLTTIRDFVQLRESGKQADCYETVELSQDKKTVTLTLASPVDSSKKYTLGVNENISFTSGAYDKLASNFVKTWSVVQPKRTDFTLAVERLTGTSYIPLEKSGVKKISAIDEVQLRIKGYNDTPNLPIFLACAYYNEDGSIVNMVNYDGGEYTLVPVGDIDETKPLDKTKIPEEYNHFKAFIWDYETFAPFIDAYEY